MTIHPYFDGNGRTARLVTSYIMRKFGYGLKGIYSLEEYNERFDQKIDKAYLEGRYGGVSVFSTVFPIKEES